MSDGLPFDPDMPDFNPEPPDEDSAWENPWGYTPTDKEEAEDDDE